jgi:hypothetical protein
MIHRVGKSILFRDTIWLFLMISGIRLLPGIRESSRLLGLSDYLAMQGISVPSEELFSGGVNLVTPDRCSLSADSIFW